MWFIIGAIVLWLILAVIIAPIMVIQQNKIKKSIELQESIIYSDNSSEQEKNNARKELEKLKREYKNVWWK